MWARLEASFAFHPKVLAAGLEAAGLYARGIAYAAGLEQNGKISAKIVMVLAGGNADIPQTLVACGLWKTDRDGGYIIHDFRRYNLSRRDLQTLRKSAKLRMKRLRSRSREQTPNKQRTNAVRSFSRDSVPDGVAEHRVKTEEKQQDPTTLKQAATETSKGRATRLSNPFPLSGPFRIVAEAEGCRRPGELHATFCDYWWGTGKPMVDWLATFRNWARRAHNGQERWACGCGGLRPTTKKLPSRYPAAEIPEDKPEPTAEAKAKVRAIVESLPWAR